jgi:hypothetical protein
MIQIVYSQMGMLIGERFNAQVGEGICSLKEPRFIQMVQGQNGGGVQFRVVPLFGSPSVVNVPDGISTNITDENVLRAYKESVSGLVLPGSDKIIEPKLTVVN